MKVKYFWVRASSPVAAFVMLLMPDAAWRLAQRWRD